MKSAVDGGPAAKMPAEAEPRAKSHKANARLRPGPRQIAASQSESTAPNADRQRAAMLAAGSILNSRVFPKHPITRGRLKNRKGTSVVTALKGARKEMVDKTARPAFRGPARRARTAPAR